ncbi:MAG: hypothetical protein ABWZ80_06895 [Beijerinckiaceae bacterium]
MRRSRRRLRWPFLALASWWIGGDLVLSSPASADSDVRLGVASLASDWPLARRAATLDTTRKALSPHDDLDPQPDLKQAHDQFPVVDRTLKGDILLKLRPSISWVPGRGAARQGASALQHSCFTLRGGA